MAVLVQASEEVYKYLVLGRLDSISLTQLLFAP
jgi:hypothetical protein